MISADSWRTLQVTRCKDISHQENISVRSRHRLPKPSAACRSLHLSPITISRIWGSSHQGIESCWIGAWNKDQIMLTIPRRLGPDETRNHLHWPCRSWIIPLPCQGLQRRDNYGREQYPSAESLRSTQPAIKVQGW